MFTETSVCNVFSSVKMIQEQSWIIKYASEPAGLATDPRIQIKSDKSKLVKWAVLPALGYHLYLWEEKRGGEGLLQSLNKILGIESSPQTLIC